MANGYILAVIAEQNSDDLLHRFNLELSSKTSGNAQAQSFPVLGSNAPGVWTVIVKDEAWLATTQQVISDYELGEVVEPQILSVPEDPEKAAQFWEMYLQVQEGIGQMSDNELASLGEAVGFGSYSLGRPRISFYPSKWLIKAIALAGAIFVGILIFKSLKSHPDEASDA